MPIERTLHPMTSHRFSYRVEDQEVGHAYLAVFTNDLHDRPFGILEDVYVDVAYRERGFANELIGAVIAAARELNCYKLIATSRLGGTRDHIHYWYERLGFESYGVEFRMNF